jgi:S1-C subfamily serine protease
MKIEGDPNGPVVIYELLPGSPAAKAGLRTGDVLVRVGNVEAKDVNTVIDAVTSFMPGDKITVEFTRDGRARSVTVTLEERPKDLPDR